ncbi:hypothetical protein D3C79_950950 [compost metagenome]
MARAKVAMAPKEVAAERSSLLQVPIQLLRQIVVVTTQRRDDQASNQALEPPVLAAGEIHVSHFLSIDGGFAQDLAVNCWRRDR